MSEEQIPVVHSRSEGRRIVTQSGGDPMKPYAYLTAFELAELARKAALWDGAPVKEWGAVVDAARKVVSRSRIAIGVNDSFDATVLEASCTIPIRFVADLETAIKAFDESH